MLRLLSPGESSPLSLPWDDGPTPTIFWVRPMTEREFSLFTAKGKETGDEDADNLRAWTQIANQITKIENVEWGGNRCASFDDTETILAILRALPAKAGRQVSRMVAEFCTLQGPYSKNSDGSSALLNTGSPIAVRAVIEPTGASTTGQSSSGSQESATAPSSPSAQ